MMRKRLLFVLSGLILSVAFTACGGASTPAPTQTPDLPLATPTTAELQPAPTPTFTPLPTQSPAPTPETEAGPGAIEPANAGQVAELARLGKGTILSHPFDAPEGMPIFSPDGMWMAIPTSAGVYIYDASSLEELHRIPQGTSFIAFSPDGRTLAASGRGAVSLWDPATGDKIQELPGNPEDYYWELSFSPDGSLLAILSWNGEIAV